MKPHTIDEIISEAKRVEGLSRDFDHPENLLTTGAITQTKFLGYTKDRNELDPVFSLSNQGRVLPVRSTGEVELYGVLPHRIPS